MNTEEAAFSPTEQNYPNTMCIVQLFKSGLKVSLLAKIHVLA